MSRIVVPEGVPGNTKAERVRAMFGQIVPRYDLMNHLMTFGLDQQWRETAARFASPRDAVALDVGTGTGDLAIELARCSARSVVAVDFVEDMLAVARSKVRATRCERTIRLVNADALQLPFGDATFDVVVNGFLLRNLADLDHGLAEMARVIRPGGRLVCLELTHPPCALAPAFDLYFGKLVPRLGGLLTGRRLAYEYLPASLAPLPDPATLAAKLRGLGFENAGYYLRGAGTVAIHVAANRG